MPSLPYQPAHDLPTGPLAPLQTETPSSLALASLAHKRHIARPSKRRNAGPLLIYRKKRLTVVLLPRGRRLAASVSRELILDPSSSSRLGTRRHERAWMGPSVRCDLFPSLREAKERVSVVGRGVEGREGGRNP